MRTFRRLYGESPLHLLALIGCFALMGYAVSKARLGPLPERMGVWFVASFVGHDLVLYPLYALADRSAQAVTSRLPRRRARRLTVADRAAAINAVRVPLALSALLLVVFIGPIRHQGEPAYINAAGLHEADYLARWLLTTGVLFLGSAVWYAARARSRQRANDAATGEPS